MPFYEIVLEGKQAAFDMLSVLHYETVDNTELDWQEIANSLAAEIELKLLQVLVPNATYHGITYRLDEVGQLGTFVAFPNAPLVGENGSGDTITQSAVNITKVCAGGIRPASGRVYQGGIAVEYADSVGSWANALMDDLDDFWGDIRTLDQLGTEVLRMVVKASNPGAPNTNDYNPVTALISRSNPVTLQRRKRGTGS